MEGKVALISGGARGQGRSHALTLAREGAKVAVFDIAEDLPGLFYGLACEDDLRETERLITEAGGECLALRADARESTQLDDVVRQVLERYGRIDVLCANHGIMELGGWDSSEDRWDLVHDVNLKSIWLTCRAAIPALIDAGGGSIICTASLGGLKSYPGSVAYCTAKAGVINLAQCLAVELAQHHIRVNAVCPSTVASPMFMNQFSWSLFAGGKPDATSADAEFAARNAHLLPVPWLSMQDISDAILWLASEESRYVTGLALPVDLGGNIQPNGVPPEAMSYITPPTPDTPHQA